MGGSVPWYHSCCTPILWEIKNNCFTNWGQLVQLTYKLSLYENRKSPHILLTNPQNSPVHLKILVDIIKILDLGNKNPSCRNSHSFSVPLQCKCSTWSSLRPESLWNVNSRDVIYQKKEKGKGYLKTRWMKNLKSSPQILWKSLSHPSR